MEDYMDKKAQELIADLMFAYINKDEDLPHAFEIEAMEECLLYLQEHYESNKYSLKMFENHLNEMKD
jgi:hypothetical protein